MNQFIIPPGIMEALHPGLVLGDLNYGIVTQDRGIDSAHEWERAELHPADGHFGWFQPGDKMQIVVERPSLDVLPIYAFEIRRQGGKTNVGTPLKVHAEEGRFWYRREMTVLKGSQGRPHYVPPPSNEMFLVVLSGQHVHVLEIGIVSQSVGEFKDAAFFCSITLGHSVPVGRDAQGNYMFLGGFDRWISLYEGLNKQGAFAFFDGQSLSTPNTYSKPALDGSFLNNPDDPKTMYGLVIGFAGPRNFGYALMPDGSQVFVHLEQLDKEYVSENGRRYLNVGSIISIEDIVKTEDSQYPKAIGVRVVQDVEIPEEPVATPTDTEPAADPTEAITHTGDDAIPESSLEPVFPATE
jgi:hypothetical protein